MSQLNHDRGGQEAELQIQEKFQSGNSNPGAFTFGEMRLAWPSREGSRAGDSISLGDPFGAAPSPAQPRECAEAAAPSLQPFLSADQRVPDQSGQGADHRGPVLLRCVPGPGRAEDPAERDQVGPAARAPGMGHSELSLSFGWEWGPGPVGDLCPEPQALSSAWMDAPAHIPAGVHLQEVPYSKGWSPVNSATPKTPLPAGAVMSQRLWDIKEVLG